MQFRSLKSVQTAFKVVRVFVVIGIVLQVIAAAICFFGGFAATTYGGTLSAALGEMFAGIDSSTALAGWALTLYVIPAAANITVLIFEWRYLTDELNRDCTPFSRRGVEQLRSVAFVAMVVPIAAVILLKIIYAFIGVKGGVSISDVFGTAIGRGIILYILAYIFEHGAELAEKVNELSGNGLPPRE